MLNKSSRAKGPQWFSGKIALVTGGASGLGRGIALALARAGCDLVLVDLNEERLYEVASVVEEVGRRCLTKQVDVSSRAQMEKLAEEVLSEWGGIDILVNNAGVGAGGELVNTPLDTIEWITGINLMGEIYGTRLFLPQMIARGEGYVVNVGSLSSLVILPFHIAYATTKFGVGGFSEALWSELRRHSIGVTLVCPGAVSTNITESARAFASNERQERIMEKFERMLENKGMDAEEAGRMVVEAIAKDRFLLLTGREAYILYYLHRFFPGFMRRLVALLTRYATGK